MRRDVFQAIADPTRRGILILLVNNSCNVNTVAMHFNMTRIAVAKHIKILEECGLVSIRKHGKEKQCKAVTHQLKVVSKWLEKFNQ